MSALSFNTPADQKNLIDTGKKVLPIVNSGLGAACTVGTVVSVFAPVAAPVTAGVCAASQVTNLATNLVAPKKK
jgi:hypothetical protein